MSFPCFSKQEGLERCEKQCNHCSKHYTLHESKMKAPVSYSISLRIPRDIYKKLLVIAKKDNRNMSNVIETMIKNQLGEINYDFTKYLK